MRDRHHDLKIEEKVARKDSLCMQFSNAVWKQGIDHYFLEEVPFSARNSPEYAKKCVDLYQRVIQHIEERDQYGVMEWGSGIGLAGYFFLETLAQENPSLYQKTTLYITEQYYKAIKTSTGLPMFTKHKSRFKRLVVDATEGAIKKPIVFAWSSFLIDSLETTPIEKDENGLWELVVSTHVEKDAYVFDTTTFPPEYHDAEDIKSRLKGNKHPIGSAMDAKIRTCLEETYTKIPWAGSCSSVVDTAIQRRFSEVETGVLNLPLGIETHLNQVLSKLCPGGVYLISDFGTTSSVFEGTDGLRASYGVSTFHSVDFKLLSYIAEGMSSESWMTQRDPGGTQEMVIGHQQTLFSEIREVCHNLFKEVGHEAISDVLDDLQETEVLDKSAVERCMQGLSDASSCDYYFLKTLGGWCLKHDQDSLAEEVAEKCIKTYQEMAFDGFFLKGWCAQRKGDHNKALEYFKKAERCCKMHATLYGSMGLSYCYLGDIDRGVDYIKKSFYWGRNNNIWDMSKLLIQLKNKGVTHPDIQAFSEKLECLKDKARHDDATFTST